MPRDRLIAISGPGITASFGYDALDRRTSKTINSIATTYIYDGVDVIQATVGGVKTDYVRTLGVDDVLSQISGGVVHHYVKDGLGSTISLVDDAGTTVSTYAYDAYGGVTVTGPDLTAFQYTGRENDDTGLMYYRARYYSPEMQRFISRDPLSFAAGDVNLYGYVGQNPVNFVDPSGKVGVAGSIIGGIGGVVGGFTSGMINGNGSILAAVAGGAVGGVTGAVIGAFNPLAGTAVGEAAGAIIGGAVGGAVGGGVSSGIDGNWGWESVATGALTGALTGVIASPGVALTASFGSGLATGLMGATGGILGDTVGAAGIAIFRNAVKKGGCYE